MEPLEGVPRFSRSGVTLYNGCALSLLPRLRGAAHLIVTDPPYKLTSGGRNAQVMSGIFASDRYDNSGELMRTLGWAEFARPMLEACRPDADAYVMANDKQVFAAHAAMTGAGWRCHNLLVWNKGSPTRNRWYMKENEYTLYLWKGRAHDPEPGLQTDLRGAASGPVREDPRHPEARRASRPLHPELLRTGRSRPRPVRRLRRDPRRGPTSRTPGDRDRAGPRTLYQGG